MSVATKVSIWAGILAAINQASIKNVLASAAISVAAPVTATAFVYEVSALRTAQLNHEASDRVVYANRVEQGEVPPSPASEQADTASKPQAPPDMNRKLDAMISSRAIILDTFGDDPTTVAPVYVRVIKQMLRDDDTTFASLAANAGDNQEGIPEKTSQLREIHSRLQHLAGGERTS